MRDNVRPVPLRSYASCVPCLSCNIQSPVPAVMDHIKISQDKATGKLTVTSIGSVDWSAWDGLWVPCAGSVTPWGTHLGSEEGEPDAWAFIREPIERQHVNVLRMARYW